MPDEHKKIGGSTIVRTINCPAWLNLSEGIPKRPAGPAADRGTTLHNFMEAQYLHGSEFGFLKELEAPDAHGEIRTYGSLSPDDQQALLFAWRATEAVLEKYEIDELVLERMVQLSDNEDIGGSADMIAIGADVAIVLDYKFGRHPVEDPTQMFFYSLCAQEDPSTAELLRGKKVMAAVVQPDVYGQKAEMFPAEENQLDELYDKVLDAVEAADAGEKQGVPGDWCKYCPAAPTCPARRQQVVGFVSYDVSVSKELERAVELVQQMKDQIKNVEEAVFDELNNGRPVGEWKLVEKRAVRHWADPAVALKTLSSMRSIKKDLYIDEKLKTPPQLETALKKQDKELPKKVLDMISQESSGLTLAPGSDKREAKHVIKGDGVPQALEDIMSKNPKAAG